MARSRGPFGSRRLNVRQQSAAIRVRWPGVQSEVRGSRLRCRGKVSPTLLGTEYQFRLEYSEGGLPRVWIEDPPLRPLTPGGRIPHTYGNEPGSSPRPCIYHPDKGEWRSHRTIATTIIPWLHEWLFFYEIWHATGEWLGGGEHPSTGSKPEEDDES